MPNLYLSSLSEQQVIESAYVRGWFFGPLWDKYHIQRADLHKLSFDDACVKEALILGSRIQVVEYTEAVMDVHRRAPHFDGFGPAYEQMLLQGRCGFPDQDIPADAVFSFGDERDECWTRLREKQGMPAVGSGNWKRCHGVGDFHACIVELDLRNMPHRMKQVLPNGRTVLQEILYWVQKSKSAFGLLFLFRLDGKDYLTGKELKGNANTDFTFVRSAPGWIGLAIVGRGETCSSKIWLKTLATYNPYEDIVRYIHQWWKLIAHELGHNEGSGHLSGDRIMNSSITRTFTDNVIEVSSAFGRYLTQNFGGEAVPIDSPDPPPPSGGNTVLQGSMTDQDGKKYLATTILIPG